MNTASTVPTENTGPAAPESNFASKSVARHLVRGVIGFGLITGSIALVPFAGPATLLAAPWASSPSAAVPPAG
ncbi:hypothetical protein M878_04775 [Streptomyces roseochromogenus subsp. oscitans DS 12.976]|uniref:Uncharacterized protein n=1 Tax=Streptomyces roseochromogenus subsp. oscitans DS 12.976 TaxID=1352936 RepID=V6KWA9_STRRC|nr:hypothetical protein M878_04775 [Streptomyces roseochromogenus subsp. oscitans DS 12.976]